MNKERPPVAFAEKHARLILGCLFLLFALGGPLFLSDQPALAALGWVGNMSPTGGSTTYRTVGQSLTVYVEVWKDGVTNYPGQGAGISCYLHWGTVPFWGGGWSSITDTEMSYDSDVGNNDKYRVTISPDVGLYEFTAYCTDGTPYWQTGGNGKLVVDTAAGSCNNASQGNNDVYWNGLGHNSFSADYRAPFGAVKTDQGTVTIKFRTCMDDVNAAPQIRVYNDRTNTENWYTLDFDSHGSDPSLGGVTYWAKNISIPTTPTILYYIFRATDGTATAYYRDDDPKLYGGGWGQGENDQQTAYNNSYQITVYDPSFITPGWLRNAVIYQIFPDRFRNGDTDNDPVQGGDWIYGQTVRKHAWTDDLCDPRGSSCPNEYSNQFYGGDLQGIIDNLDYLQQLGVTTIYLNPIFKAPSNHLYDTQDYLLIDPYFGDLTTFQTLAGEAEARGIKLILDGVFNHVSSDSKYFDRYSRWDSNGNPTTPGNNDQSGACESTASGWRSWFTFKSGTARCYDGTPGNLTLDYEMWWTYDTLPKLNSSLSAVRDYIYAGGSGSVGRYWLSQGADGWRFDVGDEVDAGTGSGDSTGYWSGFRTAAHTQDANAALLGERWGDASAWLVGDQWDSVMNYRFRSAVLSWLFDGCSGNGCSGGTTFQDNDSNDGSASGAITGLSVSQFDSRLKSIQEDYPPPAWYAMMNLMGSHDTNRVLFLLKKISNDNANTAKDKFKFLGIFQFTYPGAPTLYYGDEVGLAPDGVWDGTWWQDDPYNRAPYPWSDQGRTPDTAMHDHFRKLAVLRNQYPVLRTGDLTVLLTDDANRVYAYARTLGASDLAVIVLNRDSSAPHTVSVSGLSSAFNDTVLYDVMNCTGSPVACASYTVSGGGISNISVGTLSGAVLVKGPLPPYAVSLSVADDDLAAGDSTGVVATVTNIGGEPAADGTQVNFALLSGDGSLSSNTATVSGGNGQASVTYNAPGSGRTVALLQATSGDYAWARGTVAVFVGNKADVAVQATAKMTIGPQTADHSSQDDVNLWAQKLGNGEPVLALARYDKNPISGQTDGGNAYYDVNLNSPTGVASLTVRFHYYTDEDEDNNKLYWHNGTGWEQVTGATLNTTGTGGYLEFTFTASSTPALSALTGTPFGAGHGTPTAVDLLSFTATPQPGAILLRWETAAEFDTLGFYLYRATSPDGPQVRLNDMMIPGQNPGSPVGASYEYLDRVAQPGVTYYYWLEEVAVNGGAARHGPLSAIADPYRLYLPAIHR